MLSKCFAHIYVCAPFACSVCSGPKGTLDPLKVELQATVSCHVLGTEARSSAGTASVLYH